MRRPLALGLVGTLVVATVITVRVVVAGANGCSGGVNLKIAANPDIYPAVRGVAARWVATNPSVNNRCIRIQINPVPAADVANALAVRAGAGTFINVAAKPVPTPADEEVPDVWIPDSISWVGRVQAVNRDAFDSNITSLAMSPIVLAMPEELAQTLSGSTPRGLTTEELAGLLQRSLHDQDKKIRVGVAEPRRDAASLAGITLMYDAVAPSAAQLPLLVATYRGVDVVADQVALLDAVGRGQTIAPMSERSVLIFDAGSPRTPLAAVPLEAAQALDYPYAAITGKPLPIAQAAELFRKALTSSSNRDIFAEEAFRDPAGGANPGFPVGHGASADSVIGNPLADTRKIADVLGVWNGSKIPSRVISMTDLTAVMGQPITPGGPTRLQILQRTQVEGLKLFTDDTTAAIWGFAAGLAGGKDYVEAVSMGELDAVQRDRIATAVTSSQPVPTNSRGLYESVLAGYKALKDGWDEKRANDVIVLTGGSHTKQGGLSLEDLQLELEKLTDPTKPIRVILLGVGPDANLDELKAIAKTTGGKAFKVERPEDVVGIFLEALLRG